MKSRGLLHHPKNLTPQSDPATRAWEQTLEYGVVPRASNELITASPPTPRQFWQATSTGSFMRRVCGNLPCKYDGFFGQGCDLATGCWYPGGSSANYSNSSLSQTSISNISGSVMASEGAMWDLWMNLPGLGNPCTYGVYWSPAPFNLTQDLNYNMACPHARKRPRGQSPADATCGNGNVCSGIGLGVVNGFTTYVATDGHAIAQDFRGSVMAQATLADGSRVIKSMWPQGGF